MVQSLVSARVAASAVLGVCLAAGSASAQLVSRPTGAPAEAVAAAVVTPGPVRYVVETG